MKRRRSSSLPLNLASENVTRRGNTTLFPDTSQPENAAMHSTGSTPRDQIAVPKIVVIKREED